MMRAQAWNVSGVGRATRNIAEEAARRAGTTLGEWLDQVVADRAADQGLNPRDLSDNDRLDAIGERLGRLSRDDAAPLVEPDDSVDRPERRPTMRNAMRDNEGAATARQDDERRSDALLDAAVERLESRLSRAEDRSARAFDTVTQFIKRSEADRRDERETLRTVADRLDSIDRRASAPREVAAEPPVGESAHPANISRNLDERISDLSHRVESSERSRREAQGPVEARGDFKDAVARIARRRQELDARDAKVSSPAPQTPAAPPPSESSGWRNFGVDRAPPAAPPPATAPSPVANGAVTSATNVEPLRGQIAEMARLLDDLKRDQATRSPAAPQIADFRAELGAIARSLGDVAPARVAEAKAMRAEIQQVSHKLDELRHDSADRRGVEAPDSGALRAELGAIARSLGEAAPARLAEAQAMRAEIQQVSRELGELKRDAVDSRGASAPDVGALRAEIAAMSRSLADLAPRNAVVALEGAIRDLAQRIAAMRDDGHAEALLSPLETLAGELRASLRAHDPQIIARALAREIQAVSAKVESIAENAINPQTFERIRQQTEDVRNMLAAAALRPVPVERLEKQIGELADRVERLGASASPHAEMAQMAAALADARAQVERSTPPSVLASIEKRLEQLAQRFDEEIQNRSAPNAIDPRAFEDLARRIDAVRQSLETRLQPPVDAAKLESALKDLGDKIDRTASADPDAMQAALKDIGARLDRRTAPVIDTKPIEQALRAIGSRPVEIDTRPLEAMIGEINDKLSASASVAIDTAPLEAMIREINAKLSQAPAPAPIDTSRLEAMVRDIDAKLSQAPAPAPVDTAPLEAMVRDLGAKLSRAPAPAALDTAPLEAMVRDLDARLSQAPAPAPVDTSRLEAMVRDLDAKLSQAPAPALIDTAPLEAMVRDIDAKLSEAAATSAALDTAPIEAMMRDINAKLSAPSERATLDTAPLEAMMRNVGDRISQQVAITTRPLESALRDLDGRLEAIGAPALDTRALEDALHAIGGRLDAIARDSLGVDAFESALREIGARVDQIAATPIDTLPIESSLRALHAKLDSGVAAAIQPDIVEHAVDLLARRLEQRGARSAEMEAFGDQLAAIHDHVEQIASEGPRAKTLERTVQELLGELESTRRSFIESRDPAAQAGAPALAADMAELRIQQASADKRMQGRLSGLQDILERLVGRLGRIEDELAQDHVQPRGQPAFGGVTKSSAIADAESLPNIEAPRNRDLTGAVPAGGRPESIGREAAKSGKAEGESARAEASLDAADFLLEPGIPAQSRPREAIADAPPAQEGKVSTINAHIAAARRAAQTALAESAANKEKAKAAASALAEARPASVRMEKAKEFFAARRRPVLLGVALLALVTTLAVVELRGKLQHVQKSEINAPAAKVSALETPADGSSTAAAGRIDAAPVGSIGAAPGERKAQLAPPPAELVAGIPAAVSEPLRDAVAAGAAGAEFELAQRLLDGRGVARDPQAAARWLERAASSGLAPAQYRIGALYEKGVGVPRDAAQARTWYLKAATAGNARAMHNLAVMAAESTESKPDYLEAASWFRKAALLGVRDSQFNLAILYARGLGVTQDLGQSWVWFSLAAQQGDGDAAKKRDEVAAKLDASALNAARSALAAIKIDKPEPLSNDVAAPVGGWDAKQGAAQSNPSQATPSAPPHPQASL